MSRAYLFLFISILFFLPCLQVQAAYTIKGKVHLDDQWQPKMFMAAVEKLSDYYRASPNLIVNIANIDPDGSFMLEGDNLPEAPRYYRLYLMKQQNDDYDACLYGDDHNFVHIIINNNSQLELNATKDYGPPFQDYEIIGDRDNQLMRKLNEMVYPSFYFYQIKFPTELKFSEEKLHTDLSNFADTCKSALVALAAINHTDFDTYFEPNKVFYEKFGNRLKTELPHSVYTSNYLRKLRYHSNDNLHTIPVWVYWLFALMFSIVTLLILKVIQLQKQVKKASLDVKTDSPPQPIQEKLTRKEREILDLILDDKSNKEIATALFVELSTVKSHINKIYSKLNVKNRQEVLRLLRNEKKTILK